MQGLDDFDAGPPDVWHRKPGSAACDALPLSGNGRSGGWLDIGSGVSHILIMKMHRTQIARLFRAFPIAEI
ncbi:MAG: hypothetical protein VR78_01840 [Hoeflea sp. BRH_c9]|nr:MAG: hypothetical protein VR78_01840 [Hoeflea sp. BRH_c9]